MTKHSVAFASALMIAIVCAALAAQIPATKQPNPKITPLGPHAQQAPGGHPVMTGTIYGFVYWDSKATAHLGPSICNALAITVAVASKSPYSPFGAVGTESHLTPIITVHPTLTSINTTSYDGCAYSYDNAPLGQSLYVKVNLTQSVGTLTPTEVANYPAVGPIQFSSASCSTLPPLTKATIANLTGNWGSCQNVAYDVNLPLVKTPQLTALSSSGGSGGNQSASQSGTLLNQAPPSGLLHRTSPQNASSAASSTTGMLLPAVTPAPVQKPSNTPTAMPSHLLPAKPIGEGGTVQLNPQPYPPKGMPSNNGDPAGMPSEISAGENSGLVDGARIAANSGFTGGVKPSLLPALTGRVRVVSGRRVRNALAMNSSAIAVVGQQRHASISPGHPLASGTFPAETALPSNARLTTFTATYVPSDLLTPKQNAWCKESEAQGGAPAIFSVAGKAPGQGVIYSPDPQANPYTIIGCGFGSRPGSAQLELLQSQPVSSGWSNSTSLQNVALYTINFTIQSWSDHEIVASLAPNTSGLPDWSSSGSNSVNLLVKARRVGYTLGGQFIARRDTVLLTSIPQNQASLSQAGSPYFLSPVSNYYGLNGTLAVMRQGLAGPVAGQDQFSLKLAPSFALDSTETDLLVANTASNVTSQPATFDGSTITVTYPVLSAGSGNSTNYYSIYGLKVWVTGPQGIDPWTGKPIP